MSKDQFKQFVDTHRADFETSGEDFQQIWWEIEQELVSRSTPWYTGWMKVAAAVVVVLVSGWTALMLQSADQMPLELQETEEHYFSLIRVKMEQLSPHQSSVDDLIWQDLELLDREYEELKKDLKDNIDQEEVAQAMIENQRLKLEILDEILMEIESKTSAEDVNKLDI